MRKFHFLLLPLAFVLTGTLSGQNTLHVDLGGSAPFTSIQAAIDASTPGDIVLVEPGVYDEVLGIIADITVKSTQGPSVTTIAPSLPVTAVSMTSLTSSPINVHLEGFRITGTAVANPFPRPGGLLVTSTTLLLRNCVVTGCIGASNLGIFSFGASGAMTIDAGLAPSDVTLENCVITNNQGGSGGPASFGGTGGILVGSNATCRLRHCTVSGNTGGAGGNIPGAPGPGGAGGLNAQSGIVTVENSIFWGNQGGPSTAGPAQNEFAGFPIVSDSDIQGGFPLGTNILSVNPLFTAPAAGDVSLQGGSPVIDMGVCSPVDPTGRDVAGNPRVRGFAPDMGAYEFQHDTTRRGTSEDILLTTVVNGNQAAALFNTKNLSGGDTLVIHWESPCGSLDGAIYYLGAQTYVAGQPPLSPLPFIFLDGVGSSVIQGPAPLPAGGTNLIFNVPAGSFAPTIARLQVLVVTPLAATLPFVVTSDAHDLVLQ